MSDRRTGSDSTPAAASGSNAGASASVYWDDIEVGAVFEGGAFPFELGEIKRFAGVFDPRPTHLDETAAAATFFNGLAASGAHTFAAWARLYWDLTPGWANQAGTDISRMRLLRPVRPGDTLSLRFEVLDKKPYPLKPGFGFVDMDHHLRNQNGKTVLRMTCRIMIELRPGA
ncbi:MAG: MaoC/PaaZ C-terminal domain-containing protein [Bauldia litoralis]